MCLRYTDHSQNLTSLWNGSKVSKQPGDTLGDTVRTGHIKVCYFYVIVGTYNARTWSLSHLHTQTKTKTKGLRKKRWQKREESTIRTLYHHDVSFGNEACHGEGRERNEIRWPVTIAICNYISQYNPYPEYLTMNPALQLQSSKSALCKISQLANHFWFSCKCVWAQALYLFDLCTQRFGKIGSDKNHSIFVGKSVDMPYFRLYDGAMFVSVGIRVSGQADRGMERSDYSYLRRIFSEIFGDCCNTVSPNIRVWTWVIPSRSVDFRVHIWTWTAKWQLNSVTHWRGSILGKLKFTQIVFAWSLTAGEMVLSVLSKSQHLQHLLVWITLSYLLQLPPYSLSNER